MNAPLKPASATGARHDAFISYSRKDKAFAARLEKALESYRLPATPDSPARRLDIFRDEEDFTGTEYHSAIEDHLRRSGALIVVCSPAAHGSRYVDEEVRLFAQAHGADRIVPVLLDGVPNNEAGPDDQSRLAFPRELMAVMQMPLAVPYTGIDRARGRPDKAPFEASWFMLLANLLGLPRSEVEQRERRRQARTRNIWLGGLGTVTAMLSALTVWALLERATAREQRDDALRSQSTFLAQTSRQQADAGQHTLAIKLALQALPRHLDKPDRPWVQAAEAALLTAYAGQTFRLEFGGPRNGLSDALRQARISPDGQRALLDYGGLAELWNLATGEMLQSLRADNDHSYIEQAVFSPDSRRLVVSYVTQGTVMYGGEGPQTERGSLFDIVDAASGNTVERFQVDGHESNHVAFAPDSKTLFIGTDRRLMVLDTDSGKPLLANDWPQTGAALTPPYVRVAFAADSRKILLLTRAGMLGWIDVSASLVHALAKTPKDPAGAAFLGANADELAVAAGDQVFVLKLTETARRALKLGGGSPVLAFAAADAGARIVALTRDGRVHTWPDGAEKVLDVGSPRPKLRRAVLDDGLTAAVVELENGTVERWDLATGGREPVLPEPPTGRWLDAGLSHDGLRLLVATQDSRVRLWDAAIARSAAGAARPLAEGAAVVAVGPRADLAMFGTHDGRVGRLPLSPTVAAPPARAGHTGEVTCVAFDADGGRMVSGGEDGLALIWPASADAKPLRLEGHQDGVDFCAFSPDGTRVVTGSRDSSFRVWAADSGREIHVLATPKEFLDDIHNASVRAQAIFVDGGRKLVTVTAGDGFVITQPALVWDLATGKLEHALPHPSGAIWDLQPLAEGKQVVTASYDKSVALWDTARGERLRTFTGASSAVMRALPIDGGRMIVANTGEGDVRVYRVATGQLVHQWSSGPNLYNTQLSASGRLLALGSNREAGATVELWDPVMGTRLATLVVPGQALQPLVGLAFTADDRALVATTRSGSVFRLGLPPTGQELIDSAWSRVNGAGGELLTQEQRIRFAIQPP